MEITIPAPRPRIHLVDAMKGAASAMIVFGHVLQGAMRRGWVTDPSYLYLEHFLHSFRNGAFFFAAGLFVTGSIDRHGAKHFVTGKFRHIVYPYFLWSAIAILLAPLIAPFQLRTALSFWAELKAPLYGDLSWFLYAFFFTLMLTLLLHKVPISIRLALAVAMWLFMPATGHGGVDGFFHFYIFLVIGQLVGSKIMLLERIPIWSCLLGAPVILALHFKMIRDWGNSEPPNALFVPLGLLGTLGILLLLNTVRNTRVELWAEWIGKASLGIFLIHPYVQGIVRALLLRVFQQNFLLSRMFLVTAFALYIPALLYHQRKRLHLTWLFEWPEPSRSK